MTNDPTGLNQIYHKLGNIEGKLDALAVAMTAHSVSDDIKFASIDKKLEPLQQSMWRNVGLAGGVSTIASFIILWLKGH